jgi:glycosyltransferase involved in cell wall biosynthesis
MLNDAGQNRLIDETQKLSRLEKMSLCSNPTVSILMSVYNDASFLPEAMDSLLTQEGVECEFVIVDDAGTDGSSAILSTYSDKRITLIRHKCNKGLAASLNDGLRYCRGKYVARQDGDDVSMPGRMRKQVEYLNQHTDIAYIGSGIIVIDEEGKRGKTYLYPETPEEIRECSRKLSNPLPHSSLMFRREALLSVNGYDELFKKSEDHDLHLRLLRRFNAGNIREALVCLRTRDQSMQWSDSSGECLKYVLFAHARQLAEDRYGPQSRAIEIELLHGIDEWFQRTNLARYWRSILLRRKAGESLAKGRHLHGIIELAYAISQDPGWLMDYLMHGRRIIMTPSRSQEMEDVLERVLTACAES